MGYEWPGNVREIRNVVERAVCRWNDAGAPVGELDFDPFASAYRPRRADGGGDADLGRLRPAHRRRQPGDQQAQQRRRDRPSQMFPIASHRHGANA